MPFLIRWPGHVKPGTKYEQLIQNIDYAPTFMEAAGLDIPPEVQGESMVAMLKAPEKAKWRESIYYHYYEHGGEHQVPRHEGIRNQRYKLINFYSNDGFNLFDLKNDPNELSDVSKVAAYQDIMNSLKSELEKLRQKYDLPERVQAKR